MRNRPPCRDMSGLTKDDCRAGWLRPSGPLYDGGSRFNGQPVSLWSAPRSMEVARFAASLVRVATRPSRMSRDNLPRAGSRARRRIRANPSTALGTPPKPERRKLARSSRPTMPCARGRYSDADRAPQPRSSLQHGDRREATAGLTVRQDQGVQNGQRYLAGARLKRTSCELMSPSWAATSAWPASRRSSGARASRRVLWGDRERSAAPAAGLDVLGPRPRDWNPAALRWARKRRNGWMRSTMMR